MTDFMQIKNENPKLKQSEIANQFGYSSSTLQRYRNDLNMLAPYSINPNNTNSRTKRLQILLLTKIQIANLTLEDFKWPQITLKQFKQIQNEIWKTEIF